MAEIPSNFPWVGTDILCELLAELPGSVRTPAVMLPALDPQARSAGRDGLGPRAEGSPRPRRPRSFPAGDPLTQRVGRLLPCRGWNEDMRGEPGCGGNAVSSPGAAGCSESPRPRQPASAPSSRATSEEGLWRPGPGAAESLPLSDPVGLFGAR